MRLVIARCTVDYDGRLTAHLPSALRLLLVKADGSVSVHADDRAYKPLNWMSPPCWLTEAPGVWTVKNKADETLTITLEEIQHDSSHELGVDPGLVKDGVEAHLQELLAAHVTTLGAGWSLVRRHPVRHARLRRPARRRGRRVPAVLTSWAAVSRARWRVVWDGGGCASTCPPRSTASACSAASSTAGARRAWWPRATVRWRSSISSP